MNMQVKEFLDMFIIPEDQQFRLWDNGKEEIVFDGCIEDIPEDKEYLDLEITSIDNIYDGEPLTLNVNIDEDIIDLSLIHI